MSQATHFCLCLLIVWETTVFWGTGSNALATFDKDAFTIQKSGTEKCISAEESGEIALANCDSQSKSQQWKWGSGDRLWHVGTTKCLALPFPFKKLSLVSCDSAPILGWRCRNNQVYTVAQMGLSTTTDGKVIVKKDFTDTWVVGGSQDSICEKPYHVVYTTHGNSAGAPCEFPFKYKNKWYHECLPESPDSGLFWCSTSTNYDEDMRSGNCLLPEDGCQTLFEGPEENYCYEFAPSTAMTWQQALHSCRSQGGDLLSITNLDELDSKTMRSGLGRMPERMWIGLHQLDPSQGWQWSDGSPMSHVRWEAGMPPAFTILDSDCGVLNTNQSYEVESCDIKLPYICKKPISQRKPELVIYDETQCPDGWVPWSGWCYKLVTEKPLSFTEALMHCNNSEEGASLASFHSIDSKEIISIRFHNESQTNVWIGLKSNGTNPADFKWVNQEPMAFTFWDSNQPTQPIQDTSCVYYSGETLKWRVGECTERRAFMCQKKGEVNNTKQEDECLSREGWKRHGNSCYRVNTKEVPFEEHCNFTIRNSFEQAFINRLLADQIYPDHPFFWLSMKVNSSGEYQWMTPDNPEVTYTNWAGTDQVYDGGCVVLSTSKPLGGWRVRPCKFFKAGTICRRDLGPVLVPEPEPDNNATCPKGWVTRPNMKNCYKVFHEERLSQKRPWAEAENFCKGLGANLASFANLAEMRAVHSIVRETISDNRFFWVGLNRRNPASPSWQWSNSQAVSLDILHQDFHTEDPYSRDCAAFKTMKSNLKHLFVFLLHDVNPIPFYMTPFHCDAKLEWVCQIPRGKPSKTPEWYNPDGHHETSIFIDKHEFWFVKEHQLTFEEAKIYCGVNGSTLASPPSFTAARQIHQTLAGELKQFGFEKRQKWWLDMRDPHHLYPMTYSRLFFYNARFLGRCSTISAENIFPEYDTSCRARLPFVCQKVNATSVEINPYQPQPSGKSCEQSLAFRNKCYIEMKNPRPMTFKAAAEECASVRGTMLTVTDQVEQDFITSILATRTDVNNTWLGLKLRPNQQKWVDDSSVSFVNFNPLLHGMVKPITISQFDVESMDLCAYMYNNPHSDLMGSWDFTSCADYQPLAYCQHFADKMEEPTIPTEIFNIGDHTVLLLLQNLTWFEALEKCSENEMELASISDTTLQASLVVYVNRAQTPMWIGLFSEDEGIHYRWTDHSHTLFSRWAPDAAGGSCVYLDTDGLWKTMECEEELGGAVCHKPHEDIISTPDDVAVKCPHKINGANWIPFKNNCYSLQLVSSRWEQFDKGEARETCKNLHEDANVLSIRDAEENEFIRQQLVPFQSLVQFIWLGMFKDDIDGQMKWFDGTNVQYNNWKYGRVAIDKPFLAGLNTYGVWFFITNKNYFQDFKQKMIVACKLDKDEKSKYNSSVVDVQRYGDLTYQVLPQKLNWFEALEDCGRRGGHLASIHDPEHDTHISLISRTDGYPLWIGLSSQDTGGSDFEWSDGTAQDYSPPMIEAQSSSSSSSEARCVYVTPEGKWVKSNCQTVREGAICYTTNLTTASQRARMQAAPVSNGCPQKDGGSLWVQHEKHCYAFDMSFYNYSVFSMEQAKNICDTLDAEVLTIKTKEENDFVTKHISDDPLATSRAWLGISLDAQGQPSSWHDGSAVEYTNWKPEPLGSSVGPPKCAVLATADGGMWKLVQCNAIRSRVVCQTEASKGAPVALVFFILLLMLLLLAAAFIIYKKKRAHFTTTVRYKRTFDQSDSTSIVTDPE